MWLKLTNADTRMSPIKYSSKLVVRAIVTGKMAVIITKKTCTSTNGLTPSMNLKRLSIEDPFTIRCIATQKESKLKN